jgi:hypothetical protein
MVPAPCVARAERAVTCAIPLTTVSRSVFESRKARLSIKPGLSHRFDG